jgi:hypothetical protein
VEVKRDAGHYRMKAEEAREGALRMESDATREAMRAIAERYEALAHQAELPEKGKADKS